MDWTESEKKMYALWDDMVEFGIATEEEIGLVCAINGTRLDVLELILFVRTGYRSWDQLMEEFEEN